MTIVDVKQVVYALERQAEALQAQADRLHDQHDYSAEFPFEDAERMREAIALLSAKPTSDHDRINDAAAARLLMMFAQNAVPGWVLMPRELTEYEATMAQGTLLDVSWDAVTCFVQRYQELIRRTEGRRAALAPVVPAVGRAADRPGDLVPLANGRSVDLGGRWTMLK